MNMNFVNKTQEHSFFSEFELGAPDISNLPFLVQFEPLCLGRRGNRGK